MATVYWFDGFELYVDKPDILLNGYIVVNNPYVAISGTARTGNQAAVMYGNNKYLSKIIPGLSETTIALGVGLIAQAGFASDPNEATTPINLIDSSGNKVFGFNFTGDGYMRATNGTDYLGTTSVPVLSSSVYNYIEMKVFAHASAGTVEVRLNGSDTPVLSLTSQDTIWTGTTFSGFMFSGLYNDKLVYIDDLYLASDFLGDSKVDPIRVTGAGNYSQFTPSAGSNYENVDESPGPDDDTTYNDGDAVDEIDTYEMGDLSAGGTIHAFKSQMTIKKTEAGSAKVKHALRINSSDYLGDEKVLTTDYTTKSHIWNVNPDDSAAFETADINALELGVKITELV